MRDEEKWIEISIGRRVGYDCDPDEHEPEEIEDKIVVCVPCAEHLWPKLCIAIGSEKYERLQTEGDPDD